MSALSQFFGGSIKRIQRGTITVPNNTTTATITLPFAVDPNKSVLTNLGNNTSRITVTLSAGDVAYATRTAYLQLTDSGTTLTATGALTAGNSVDVLIISWQIVEYN